MWIAGAATQVEAVDSPEPSLLVLTSPVLLITPLPSGQTPPVAAVVGEMMCTVNVDSAWVVSCGTVTPLAPPHFKTPVSIEQVPSQPSPCSAIDQSRPALTGSVSVSFTPLASPAPVLKTV